LISKRRIALGRVSPVPNAVEEIDIEAGISVVLGGSLRGSCKLRLLRRSFIGGVAENDLEIGLRRVPRHIAVAHRQLEDVAALRAVRPPGDHH
jgi:hypothetical protein